jgi:hypothetical protein
MCRSGRRKGKSLLPPSQTIRSASAAAAASHRRVVDAGEQHPAGGQMGFVLLPLLQRAIGGVQVRRGGESLYALPRQVAVGHGVAHHRHPQATLAQRLSQMTRDLGLAATGAHRRNRDHRPAGGEHGALGAEQQEIGAGGQRPRPQRHELVVADVTVGEQHGVYAVRCADRLQLGLRYDGNAVRVARARQRHRVTAVVDAGNLGRRERHHPPLGSSRTATLKS